MPHTLIGLLPETVSTVDYQVILSSLPSTNGWRQSEENHDDENHDPYQYDLAPKQDEERFYFGLASHKRGPFHIAESSDKKTKQHQPSWQSQTEVDEDNVYYYELAPKQDAQQYYFGTLAQPASYTIPPCLMSTKSKKTTAIAWNATPVEDTYEYDLAPKQDKQQQGNTKWEQAIGNRNSHAELENFLCYAGWKGSGLPLLERDRIQKHEATH